MIKKILVLILTVITLFSVCGCKNNSYYEKDIKLSGTHNAVITVKDYGEIKLELYGDIAPVTVANFVGLVKEGFYNGLTFHRAVENYMLQGGDPFGNGNGNSEKRIFGEFSENGFENKLSHTRGVISMARSSNYNSASCQFFIMQADETRLDGSYAAFGIVTEGMEVVDKIIADVLPTGYNGLIDDQNQPVIEKIEMIE